MKWNIKKQLTSTPEAEFFVIEHENTEKLLKFYKDGVNPDSLLHSSLVNPIVRGTQDGRKFELMPSFEKLNPNKNFSDKEIKELICQIASGIDFLHSNNIIHRGISPENIVNNGTWCLANNGSSVPIDNVCMGDIVGDFNYMAPEAATGMYSKPSDWWSLGAVLYELITGKKLSIGNNLYAAASVEVNIPDCGIYTNLLKGLLNKNIDARWSFKEVEEWNIENENKLNKIKKAEKVAWCACGLILFMVCLRAPIILYETFIVAMPALAIYGIYKYFKS